MDNQGSLTQRPNLLYIHSDQHNPAVTGCYGDPLVQTPHLDGLAARGLYLIMSTAPPRFACLRGCRC